MRLSKKPSNLHSVKFPEVRLLKDITSKTMKDIRNIENIAEGIMGLVDVALARGETEKVIEVQDLTERQVAYLRDEFRAYTDAKIQKQMDGTYIFAMQVERVRKYG